MVSHLKDFGNMLSLLPEDGAAPDQVVGEATAHQAYNRYGP